MSGVYYVILSDACLCHVGVMCHAGGYLLLNLSIKHTLIYMYIYIYIYIYICYYVECLFVSCGCHGCQGVSQSDNGVVVSRIDVGWLLLPLNKYCYCGIHTFLHSSYPDSVLDSTILSMRKYVSLLVLH